MLSLGLGLTRETPVRELLVDVSIQPILTTTFVDYSVSGGALTKTESQTVDGTSGWLKIVYPNTAQTDISGLRDAEPGFIEDIAIIRNQHYWRATFDIFLETAADWTEGAGNTTVQTSVQFANSLYKEDIAPDTTVSVDTGAVRCAQPNNNFSIYFRAENDLPEAGATYYIKNFTLKVGVNEAAVS